MCDDTQPPAPFRLITAAQAGFPSLYRYQPFDLDRLSRIIRDRVLYLPNPKDFNDPWDCRPWFDLEGLTDSGKLERHIAWLGRVARKHCPDMPEEEIARRSESFRSNPAFLQRMMLETTSEFEGAIQDRYRVYCLGSTQTSELMWAHYSDKHVGICLEFASRNALFCHALQVHYQEAYPIFDLSSDADDDSIRLLLTKSAAWRYEGEFRLIAQEEASAVGSDTILARDHLIDIPENALIAVILGSLAPESTAEAIKTLVRQSGSSIAVRRAIRAHNQYGLTFVEA